MPLFCSHCGSENKNQSSVCQKCDAPIGHIGGQDQPESGTPSPGAGFSNDSPLIWVGTAVLCVLYLIYPSLGIFELIPDAVPFIGSLDEMGATTGLLYSLFKLGWIPFIQTTKKQ